MTFRRGTAATSRPVARRTATMVVTAAVVAVVAAGCTTGTDQDALTPAGASTPSAPASPGLGELSRTATSTPAPSVTPSATPSATATTSAPTSTPDPTSTKSTSEQPTGTSTTKAAPTEHQDLRSGDHGSRVLALQKKLQSDGYWITDADGTFGPSTLQAVWAAQKVAGLGRDGVVGPKTLAAVKSGHLPTPRSHSGHVIEVDLAKQILMIVDDGKVTTVLNASTGSGKKFTSPSGPSKGTKFTAVTPTGTYAIGRQYDALYESKLGLGKMWRPKFFNGGIAIHGLWYDVPPEAASHGCVRVSNPAMDWIWSTNKAPQGTTVIVY